MILTRTGGDVQASLSINSAGFTRVELFGADDCARLRGMVEALRRLWRQHHQGKRLFTLGASLYLDAQKHGFAAYQEIARRVNPILRASLGWLYDDLRASLQQVLDGEVRYHDGLALPGFHVMLADDEFIGSFADAHFDQQFALIDFEACAIRRPARFDAAHARSITLAVDLPAAGGGMYHWDIDKERALAMPRGAVAEATSAARRQYLEYRRGSMIVHSGFELHQIASWPAVHPDDVRITLQGHAVQAGDSWILYW